MAAIAEAAPAAGSSSHERRPGWGAWLFLAPLLLWLTLFVVIPSVLLIVYGFCERDGLGRIVFNFTWDNYLRAIDWRVWQDVPQAISADGWAGLAESYQRMVNLRIILRSVWYAFLTTIICMAVGYPVAFFIG